MADKYAVTKSLLDNLNDTISEKCAEVQERTIPEMAAKVSEFELKEPVGGKYPNRKTEWTQFPDGVNLGNELTQAQSAAIQSGSFEGLGIGDYWVINDMVWRIAAFDYYWGIQALSDTPNVHHVILVPDQWLYESPLSEVPTDPGVKITQLQYSFLADARNIVSNAWPTNVTPIKQCISYSEYDEDVLEGQSVWLMNSVQVLGHICRQGDTICVPDQFPYDTTRFPLFADTDKYVNGWDWTGVDNRYWLINRATSETEGMFACISEGDLQSMAATEYLGIRPAFVIGNI